MKETLGTRPSRYNRIEAFMNSKTVIACTRSKPDGDLVLRGEALIPKSEAIVNDNYS